MPALLDRDASRGELSPKSDASVALRDEDGEAGSPLDESVPGCAARTTSRRSLLRLTSLISGGKTADTNEEADAKASHRVRPLVLKGHTDPIDCVAALDGGQLASSGGRERGNKDYAIHIWNVADGKQLTKLEGHTGPVSCLAALVKNMRLNSAQVDAPVDGRSNDQGEARDRAR